ncbi:MAG: alpha-mannosidase, partial [Candidatus Promineifilaceae bacterium]
MRHKIRWTAQKLRKRLELIKPLVFTDRRALRPFSYHILEEPIPEPISTKQNDVGDGRLVKPGDYWAGPDTTFSLRTTFSTAGFHLEYDQIVLLLPIGISGDFSHPEALVYIDDVPVAACDRHHQEILLPFQFRDGGEHQLLLRGWTGGTRQPEENRLQMNRCYIARIDPLLKEFTATARAALGISEQLTDDNPIKHNLVSACDEAFLSLDTREPIADRFFESVPAALEILRKKLISAGPPHLARISAVGHAHIDLAWLWTIEETKRKANRTFTNVLSLMAEEPSFTFTQSQPQLYS